MDQMIQSLVILRRIIGRLWRTGNWWLRWPIIAIPAWFLLLILSSAFGTALVWLPVIAVAVIVASRLPNWEARIPIAVVTVLAVALLMSVNYQTFTAILALLPVTAAIAALAAYPVLTVVAAATPAGRRVLWWGGVLLAAEAVAGILLAIIPVNRNPGAVPLFILTVVALLLVGAVAGTVSGKTVANATTKVLYVIAAVLVLSFFLPRAFQATGNMVGGVDSAIASALNGNVQPPTAQQVQPQQQTAVAQAAAGITVRRGEPPRTISVGANQCSDWIDIQPRGSRYDASPSGPVTVYYEDGPPIEDGPGLNPDAGGRRAHFYICAKAQPVTVSVVAR